MVQKHNNLRLTTKQIKNKFNDKVVQFLFFNENIRLDN